MSTSNPASMPREKPPRCGQVESVIGHTYSGVPPWFLPKPGQRCFCGERTWPEKPVHDSFDNCPDEDWGEA